MTSDRNIKSIHVLTTGWGEVHREHREGTWLPRLWWVLTSRSWIKVPVNCFLLEHHDGLVLFDTGLDPAIAYDPDYISSAIGRFLLHRIFRLHINEDETLDRKLDAIGFSATDIDKAVISHLHFDHVGGIAKIPRAELIVSKTEWELLSAPHPERDWMLREHIQLPASNWRPVAFAPPNDDILAPFGGCYDVMGDGSMILLPTPGHTPGSMSMLVRTQGMPPLLLAGDLAYDVRFLMRDRFPGTGDEQQLRVSYANVRRLKQHMPDLLIVPSHDSTAADALRAVVPIK